MGKRHRPRRGSLQFWPRKRAERQYGKVRTWTKLKDTKVLGFAGYKAGMTHVFIRDNSSAPTKGEDVFEPVTVIECPPIKVLGIRFYKKHGYGYKIVSDVYSSKIDKEIERKIKIKNKGKEPESFDDLRLIVYTQPKLAKIGKKKPELFEVGVSGEKSQKLETARKLLDKELKMSEVFKAGQLLDIHGVSKGKGFQGTVKRFGVVIRHHKSEKTKRGIGTIGPWTPKRVSFRVPMPGKMGFHTRTEYNKWVLKLGNNPEEINPKGGFLGYGFLKNEFMLLKGSVPGPRKRLIIMSEPIRQKKKSYVPDINYVSLESKQ